MSRNLFFILGDYLMIITRKFHIIYLWLGRNINSQKSERGWHHKTGGERARARHQARDFPKGK